MKIIEYMQQKYQMDAPTVLTAAECKAFGIPYPLRAGWIEQHGQREITADMRDVAIFRLGRKATGYGKPQVEVSPFHQRGIDILKGLL